MAKIWTSKTAEGLLTDEWCATNSAEAWRGVPLRAWQSTHKLIVSTCWTTSLDSLCDLSSSLRRHSHSSVIEAAGHGRVSRWQHPCTQRSGEHSLGQKDFAKSNRLVSNWNNGKAPRECFLMFWVTLCHTLLHSKYSQSSSLPDTAMQSILQRSLKPFSSLLLHPLHP